MIMRIIFSLVMGVISIGQAWAYLRAVPDACLCIVFAVIGGVNIGFALCCVIVYLTRRNDS